MVVSRLPFAKHTEHLTLSSCVQSWGRAQGRQALDSGSSLREGARTSKEEQPAWGPGPVTPQT